MSSQQLALLQSDYQSLAKEAGRRHSDVREAAEKAFQLLKSSREQALLDLRADPPPSPQPLYLPIFLASATRNVKVIALAVSALQRLIASGSVPKGLVKQILDTLEQVIPQGVEIQLKILQTLVSLLTTTVGGAGNRRGERLVQGDELGQALELSHRLSTSKIPVVASTASATLRQLFMFVFERVGEEDAQVSAAQSVADPALLAALPAASFNLDVPPSEHDAAAPVIPVEEGKEEEAEEAKKAKSIALRPAARDAYLLLEDLCLLISGSAEGGPEGEPSFLRWGTLSRTFGLELVESIVSGFGPVVRTHPELLLVLRAHLCPLLIRFLSSPPHPTNTSSATTFSFPLTLRLTRVVFLLLKQFSDLLSLEAEIFLNMFVRVIGPGDKGEGEGGHPAGPGSGNSPLWMRVLALEIFRGLCGDFQLMMKFYQRYDATKVKNGGGSSVFSDLMTAFNRLATEKPGALGSGAAVVYGSSLAPILGHQTHGNGSSASLGGAAGMLDSAMETGVWLAGAAGSVVGSSVGAVAGAVPPGLNVISSSLKLQCIDQLDKADAPPIPETYIFLLALQCLSSLADGFATYTLSTFSSIMANRPREAAEAASRAPPALDWTTLDVKSDPKVASLITVKNMAETSWPALLASFSFFIATNLDDDLFADVVSALQNFTSVCGVLGLGTPREAFLTSLCKFAMPPAVVSHIASTSNSANNAHHDITTAGQLKNATSSVISAGVESLGLGGTAAHPVGLSSRNFACLKALISVAHYLAGSLDATWFAVFETLQNAEFVIRTNAARAGKKRSTAAGGGTPGAPATPKKGETPATPMSPSSGSGSGLAAPTKIPVLPTEADELAIQQSIAKLFEVSRSLDDEAFKWFVGALCRLNGEMIGVPMTEDGAVAEMGSSASSLPSPGEAPSPSAVSEARSRRRTSGITTIRSQRLGEKSFGISKLGVVSLLNVHRLIYREPRMGWDVVTSHLLLVQHYVVAPPSIRLQAAEVLDQILVVAPKNISTGGRDLQQRVQTQVLTALAEHAEPSLRPQSSTDIEIRRMALDTLFKILESNGHSFISGWERIFHVLRTACPSPLLQHALTAPASPLPDGAPHPSHPLDTISEDDSQLTPRRASTTSYFGGAAAPAESKAARTPVLVRTSFPSLQLICTDFLGGLTVEELRDCISTLAEFGKQADDVNVALTAGGLLWSVSDHLQAKRQDGDDAAHGDLWMYLLHQLLGLCRDGRQEVRDGAITNIFRSISLYGSTLSAATWDATLWNVVFPLVEAISDSIQARNRVVPVPLEEGAAPPPGEELVSQPNGPPLRLADKQWDDSKTLALRSTGNVFFEYLPLIVKTERYEETWAVFVGHLKQSFVEDRPQAATAAMQSLEKVLSVSLDGGEASRIASSWEVAWAAWDEIGSSIDAVSHSSSPSGESRKTYTQINLEAYVRCVLPIYTPPYIPFDLTRIQRLLAILKSVLTFSRSPDYRPDVDSLTPLQAAVLEVVAVINLEVPGAASAVLSDLSEYLTLAFVAAFDSEPEAGLGGRGRSQRISYVALSKETMPHVLWLFQRYKDDASIYEQGAVERMLAAYAIPIKLKHDCPAPAKFSSAELLWKTATVNFLKAVKDCIASLQVLGSGLPAASYEGIWRQIVEGFKGGLLADVDHGSEQTFEERHQEENFDLALLVSLEQNVLPSIGASLVPDDLIRRLGKSLQTASRLYELDLPDSGDDSSPPTPTPAATTKDEQQPVAVSSSSSSSGKETRFDPDFDRQAKGSDMYGTTAEVVEVGRERFAYWCFDLLFLLCSDEVEGHETERRRIAALCLPALLNRCTAVIKTYVADAPLRGKMPFPRVRQEELIYILQKLHRCRLRTGTLWASTQLDPSSSATSSPALDTSLPLAQLVRSALLRSPRGHLYELHQQFTALLSLSTSSPSITSAYIPYRRLVGSEEDDVIAFKGLPEGFKVERIGRAGAGAVEEGEGDVVQLALACLKLVGEEIGSGGL